MALTIARGIGLLAGDLILTRDEIEALMAGLLAVSGAPTGRTRLTDWLREYAETVGAVYASELQRHYRR